MRVNNPATTNYQRQTSPTTQRSDTFSQLFQSKTTNTSARTDSYSMPTNILIPTKDTLYSNKTGNYRYDKDSTDENPIMLVEGYDDKGQKFEKRIHVNKVNPYSATEQEMTALGVHLGKVKDMTSRFDGGMPLDYPNLRMNERVDFIAIFSKNISDQTKLNNTNRASMLRSSMEQYINFYNNKDRSY